MRNASDTKGGRGERTKALRSLQDLQRRIDTQAKAEPSWRFWGLYVHLGKKETLCEAYRLTTANNGAPGSDGVTFEAMEASGVDVFLQQMQDDLVHDTYQPRRARQKAIPQDGGTQVRILSIPTIRDRVVQGALTRILEPICAADCQPGSSGYRPKRRAQDAVLRVADAIGQYKTRVIDLDLQASCENVRHHLRVAKVAQRVQDPDILPLLQLILKASGPQGVAQGGVIAPLGSHLYLPEVDRMLERAQEVTRHGRYTSLEYARFADDLVILVEAYAQHDGLLKAVAQRRREALEVLHVTMHEAKSRTVDLAKGESFGWLGLAFRRRRSRTGTWRADYPPLPKKRTALGRKLQDLFRRHQSQPIDRVIALMTPMVRGWGRYLAIGDASRCLSFVKDWVEKKVRRHLRRARKRRGFGGKRWRRQWLYKGLGLFNDSRVQRPQRKALPAQEVP